MCDNIKCIILVIMAIVLVIMFSNKVEGFKGQSSINTQSNLNTNPELYKKQADIIYDPLFQNMTIYSNDLNPYAEGEENGLSKCLKKCNGKCVEFGQTGIAWCFK